MKEDHVKMKGRKTGEEDLHVHACYHNNQETPTVSVRHPAADDCMCVGLDLCEEFNQVYFYH